MITDEYLLHSTTMPPGGSLMIGRSLGGCYEHLDAIPRTTLSGRSNAVKSPLRLSAAARMPEQLCKKYTLGVLASMALPSFATTLFQS